MSGADIHTLTTVLEAETVIEVTAELWAVETLLTRLWGYQDGGRGNIADRIGSPATRLLAEAFPREYAASMDADPYDEHNLVGVVNAKACAILAKWLDDVGEPTPRPRPRGDDDA